MKPRPWGLLLAGLLLLGTGSQGMAASQTPAQKDGHTLESITITAEKRKQNLQEVTNSVTVLSDLNIEDAGIKSTFDIHSQVPNLRSFETASRVYFSIFNFRGIANTAFGDPAFTLYIDDVPATDFYDFNNTLFDIQRIEVLRGPQGTLYGQNTEAGVINIISKKPGNTLEGRVQTEITNYAGREISAGIRGPIVQDKLFFGFSGLTGEREGYVENIHTGEDVDSRKTLSGRGQLRWTPSKDLDLMLTLAGEDFDDGGWSYLPQDRNAYAQMFGSPDIGEFQTWTDHRGKADLSRDSQALRISWDLPGMNLVAVTARKHLDSQDTLDGDFTIQPMFIGFNRNKTTHWSQEIRLASADLGAPLSWIIGGYYSHKDARWLTGYQSDMDNGFGQGLPKGVRQEYDADFEAKTYAVFGKAGYRFFNQALGINAGLRFEQAERAMERDIRFNNLPTAPHVDDEQKNRVILPKIALDYRFTPDIMCYTSAAKGYRAGGFSHAVSDPAYVAFDPETIWTYELGARTTWLNRRLMVNLTGFYSDVKDFQDSVHLDPMTVIQTNAAEAAIWGLEAEISFRPVAGLDITGSLGWINARYEDYREDATGKDFSDNKVIQTPECEYNLAVQYRFPWGLYLRAEADGNTGYYFDRANQYDQDGYILFHAKAGFETENWDITFFGSNLGDKEYHLAGSEIAPGLIMGNVGAPRTLGCTVSYRF